MISVLIISRTPWNNSNSFGNTFSNLFEGMPDVSIYSICCQSGSIDNRIVKETFQMSDISVLKSIIGKPVRCANQEGDISDNGEKIVNVCARHKSTFMFLMRNIIWFLGRSKWKKAVSSFIEKIKPDVIYLPMYASWYMCNIDLFAIKFAKVPVVGHITDDIYGIYPGLKKTSGEYWYRKVLQNKEEAIVKKLSYIEVFADNMKREYELIFNKPCFVIGKGVSLDEISKPQLLTNSPAHFVYTGGIAGERFEVLLLFGRALENIKSISQSVLDIYSATPLSDSMIREMERINTIRFHGAVDGDAISEIQKNADFLIHVEGFSEKSIFGNRMSFSTKIIDYLMTGRTLIAIGPRGINSIDLIADNGIGLVVDKIDEITPFVRSLLSGKIDTELIQRKAYSYLIENRIKKDIQNLMLSRIKNL